MTGSSQEQRANPTAASDNTAHPSGRSRDPSPLTAVRAEIAALRSLRVFLLRRAVRQGRLPVDVVKLSVAMAGLVQTEE